MMDPQGPSPQPPAPKHFGSNTAALGPLHDFFQIPHGIRPGVWELAMPLPPPNPPLFLPLSFRRRQNPPLFLYPIAPPGVWWRRPAWWPPPLVVAA